VDSLAAKIGLTGVRVLRYVSRNKDPGRAAEGLGLKDFVANLATEDASELARYECVRETAGLSGEMAANDERLRLYRNLRSSVPVEEVAVKTADVIVATCRPRGPSCCLHVLSHRYSSTRPHRLPSRMCSPL
jgi:hypothetical protein